MPMPHHARAAQLSLSRFTFYLFIGSPKKVMVLVTV